MTTYIMRRVPKQIRGMVLAFSGAASCAGMTIYLELTAILVNDYGARMVFGSVIFLDLVVLVPLLLAIAFGWYGKEKEGDDN